MAAEATFSIRGHHIPGDATSFTVEPINWDGEELTSDFTIFRGKEDRPLEFSIKTMEETREVVRELAIHGVRWASWLNEARVSLKDRKIELLYNPHVYMWEDWGKLYQLLSETLNLPKGKLVKVKDDPLRRRAVCISFEEGPRLEERMQETLTTLQKALYSGVKYYLRQTESPWKEFAETLPD